MGWLSPLSPAARQAPHEIAGSIGSARPDAVQGLERPAGGAFGRSGWLDVAEVGRLFLTRQKFHHARLPFRRDVADHHDHVLVGGRRIEIFDDPLHLLAFGDELRVV